MRIPSTLAATAALAIASSAQAAGPKAPAAGSYDGRWSIEVITERGTCDRAYRYGVRIERGEVRYEGGTDFTVSGQVTKAGAVRGSIARGEARADVVGALSGEFGAGTWHTNGASPCSGNWNAERRG